MTMKRTRFEIMSDILVVAMNGVNKTRLVYGSNLNFKIVNGYIGQLQTKGLLIQEGKRYKTTEKGSLYIRNVEVIL